MLYKKPMHRRPFGMPFTPFNPVTGAYLPVGNPDEIRAFTLIKAYDSHLLCECMVPAKTRIAVAKPYVLRRDMFDELTVNDVTYTYEDKKNGDTTDNDDYGQREAVYDSGGPDEATEIQQLTFPYISDEDEDNTTRETIIAWKRDVHVSEYSDYGVKETTKILCHWEDLNTAGRGWEAVSTGGGYYCAIVSYDAGTDTYEATPWNFETGAGEDNITGIHIPNSGGTIPAGTEIWVNIDSYGSYVGVPYGLYEPWT